jgi:hypothetical protein
MPKNTFLLIAILAVFAALVIGVNIGKKFTATPEQIQQVVSVTPSPSATPTPSVSQFIGCGITLTYPALFTKIDIETGGALLVNSKDTKQSIAIACQKDIPRPALTTDKIQTAKIGSMSASLYHDASEKDGTAIDKFIFKHPKTGLDIYISGYGETYMTVLSTITLL